jgi:hypothetical protein
MSQNPYLTGFTGYTTDLTALNADERSFLAPSAKGGRIRALTFDHTFSAATGTVAAKVALGVLPRGAVPVLITFRNGAGAGTAALNIGTCQKDGTTVTATRFLSAASVVSAGTTTATPLTQTPLPDELVVTAIPTATVANATTFSGTLLYVVNS